MFETESAPEAPVTPGEDPGAPAEEEEQGDDAPGGDPGEGGEEALTG